MRKCQWWFVVSLALLPLSGRTAHAFGGTKLTSEDGTDVTVSIDHDTKAYLASGSLGTARSEPFLSVAYKWIGCWIETAPGGSILTCEAVQDSGPDLRCATSDPTMIAAAGLMNDDSYIEFETPSLTSAGVGNCTSLRVENGSQYYPKAP